MNLADSLEKRTTALTVSDVAKVLHVSVRQVYSLVASNKIPHIRVGGSIRFDPCEFAAWLRQSMIKIVVSSTGRNHQNRQPVLSRSSRAATRSSQAYPQIEVPSSSQPHTQIEVPRKIRSRRKPPSKARPSNQQQYRLSFGPGGALPPTGTEKEERPPDFHSD